MADPQAAEFDADQLQTPRNRAYTAAAEGFCMYVCSCNRLTDTQVTEAICAGAASPDAVYAACGCRKQCGGCAATMTRYIGAAAQATASFSAERASAVV